MSALKDRLRAFGFRRWRLMAVEAVLCLACVLSAAGLWAVKEAVDVSAGERFAGESGQRFSQVAAFLPVGQGKSEEDILAFRQALENKFVEQALKTPENGSLYVDAYSGRSDVTVATEHGTAGVTAFGVGGDFFYFHPLALHSGAYIAERDLMDDLVVLDEVLAWRLFGGTELAGLTVYINGAPFVVSGVVSMEDDFASRAARKDEGCLFMSFSAMKKLNEEAAIDCYEIVLPDPITGYGRSVVGETFSDGAVVENTGRYSPRRLVEVAKDFGHRSMRADGVIYPYWENARRLTEDYAALLLFLTVLFAVVPALSVLVLAIQAARSGWRRGVGTIRAKLEAAMEQRRERQYGEFLEKKGENTWHS